MRVGIGLPVEKPYFLAVRQEGEWHAELFGLESIPNPAPRPDRCALAWPPAPPSAGPGHRTAARVSTLAPSVRFQSASLSGVSILTRRTLPSFSSCCRPGFNDVDVPSKSLTLRVATVMPRIVGRRGLAVDRRGGAPGDSGQRSRPPRDARSGRGHPPRRLPADHSPR